MSTAQRSRKGLPSGITELPPVIGRTTSGGYRTEKGTLYVSKPFRSSKGKKLRAMVAFTPRKSAFDTTNELSGANEFRVSIFLVYSTRYRRLNRDSSLFFGSPSSSSLSAHIFAPWRRMAISCPSPLLVNSRKMLSFWLYLIWHWSSPPDYVYHSQWQSGTDGYGTIGPVLSSSIPSKQQYWVLLYDGHSIGNYPLYHRLCHVTDCLQPMAMGPVWILDPALSGPNHEDAFVHGDERLPF